MTTEEKFRAAVNVIRSLPKNASFIGKVLTAPPLLIDGSYQPSSDLMLRFYAYYKQATLGPCTAPRPAFWEVIKKMKWEAWNKLGNMSKDEAKNNYVEELKKIVETMSYTDNVANFLGSLDSFYDSVPVEDLELLVGNVIERIRSQPGSPLSGSPLASREASPHRMQIATNGHHITSSLETSPASSYSPSPQPGDLDEEDEDEFIDTVETEPERFSKEWGGKGVLKSQTLSTVVNGNAALYSDPLSAVSNGIKKKSNHIKGRVNHEPTEGVLQNNRSSHHERGRPRERNSPRSSLQAETAEETLQMQLDSLDVTDKIQTTVVQLEKDVTDISSRMEILENTVKTIRVERKQKITKWWPFRDVSPGFTAFVIIWPMIVHLGIVWLQRRRQHRLL